MISIESRFVWLAGGGGVIFLFDNAVLYRFAWRGYDCPRVLSD